jgi:hypothetical protein
MQRAARVGVEHPGGAEADDATGGGDLMAEHPQERGVAASSGRRTLTATGGPSPRRPRNTVPIPPAPRRPKIWYGPIHSGVPGPGDDPSGDDAVWRSGPRPEIVSPGALGQPRLPRLPARGPAATR